MTSIPFVDAHVHFWDLARISYPWLRPPFGGDGPNGSVEAIARDYLPGDYRADLAGWNLVGAVHVDAGAEPELALAETRWLEDQAAEGDLPTGIVAYAPLHEAGVELLLEQQAAHGRVRGIRQIVNWHPDPRRSYTPADLTSDERWQTGFALLGRYGLSFDLQCYPGQMATLANLIGRNEGIPVVINHLGMPVVGDDGGVDLWRNGMRHLAALPNVSVKLSGFGFIARDWDLERVRPFVEETIDLFGTGRCMLASDFPTDKLFSSATQALSALRDLTCGLSDAERRDVFGRNANRVYRLGLSL